MKKTQILILALLISCTTSKIHAFLPASGEAGTIDEQSESPIGCNSLLECVSFPDELIRQKDLYSLILEIPNHSDELKSVINEIEGTVSIVLTDELERTASCRSKNKTIYISRTLFNDEFEFASQLVFEMCNVANKYFAIYPQIEEMKNILRFA